MLCALALYTAVSSVVLVETIVTVDTVNFYNDTSNLKLCLTRWLLDDPACKDSEITFTDPPVNTAGTLMQVRLKGQRGPECAIFESIWAWENFDFCVDYGVPKINDGFDDELELPP